MHPDIYSNIIYDSQIMETVLVPIQWLMDKEEMVYSSNNFWWSL